MREIKFRAWYKREERMLYKGFFDRNWYYTPKNDDKGCHTAFELMPEHFSRMKLMQYIGLKDKNGQEIYEGDIVILSPIGSPQLVEWSDFHTGFVFRRGDTTTAIPSIYPCEVIGNIYENPELIK